tara:strand:- start:10389 stop:11471 length:1083 start_codon:yes stop_codon:yes gene_type:complete
MEVITQEENITLHYQEGASDKIYQAELIKLNEGWVVYFAYGRRGSSLTQGTKTKQPVKYEAAKKVYNKLVLSKVAKGYASKNSTTTSITTITNDKEDSGIRPQLLNEISKNKAQFFINDDQYCMQEKFDGRRRMIIKNLNDDVTGVNKKGLITPLTSEIAMACDSIEGPYIIDGEDMGDKIMLFDDITESTLSYLERYDILEQLAYNAPNELEVVKTAWETNTKQIMFDRLKRERAEGVVFKLIDAPYYAGRPASGGDQLKCKFYDTASCIVESVSSVKSSIGLKVYDDSHPVSLVGVSVGNATLYPNSPKIEVGDIVEVKYLYYNEGGSLYQPVLLEKRDDVNPNECTLVKLKRKKNEC